MVNKENIRVIQSVDTWQDAIRESAQTLLKNGNIKEEYIPYYN